MALNGTVKPAPDGVHGFDCNTVLNGTRAQLLRQAGFAFCIRYVSRHQGGQPGDLTKTEAEDILGSGLALMAVQHVEPEGWTPTEPLGRTYGRSAAFNAMQAGLIDGINLWLDLEGVNHTTSSEDVIAYCNAWFGEVAAGGLTPGIYVGANSNLSGDQLYWRLKTKHYWKSGSNVPPIPHRGYQMTQYIASGDAVAGVGIDRNVTHTDGFGDTVLWHAP